MKSLIVVKPSIILRSLGQVSVATLIGLTVLAPDINSFEVILLNEDVDAFLLEKRN